MPEVTLCVLTYGDYPRLARRVIESIRTCCPRSEYALVVGANAVCPETRSHFETLQSAGHLDHLVLSETNINKCPMMRRMFERVNTEFIWWFDDDSHVTSPEAFAQWIQAAKASPESTVMWGALNRCNFTVDFTDLEDVVAVVRGASWYRGLPPPSWQPGGKGEFNFQNHNCGDGNWDFIVGGSWLARTSALRALDWPDPRLVKLGDDVLLGEAIRQQGWDLGNIGSPGVAVNTELRRGDAGSSSPEPPTRIPALHGDDTTASKLRDRTRPASRNPAP
jgi:hypothetical protein